MQDRGKTKWRMEIPLSKIEKPLVERRRFPRLHCGSPIQFRNVLIPQNPFDRSLSKDLSAGGICMATTHFVPVEQRLVLVLALPGLPKPIRVVGRVVWTQQNRFAGTYDSGVEFLEMSSQDRETIAEYVERGVTTRPAGRSSTDHRSKVDQ